MNSNIMRGNPVLTTFLFLVASGGTINGCMWRIVGTFVGVLVGWAALAADPGPYATIFFGFVLCKWSSLPPLS